MTQGFCTELLVSADLLEMITKRLIWVPSLVVGGSARALPCRSALYCHPASQSSVIQSCQIKVWEQFASIKCCLEYNTPRLAVFVRFLPQHGSGSFSQSFVFQSLTSLYFGIHNSCFKFLFSFYFLYYTFICFYIAINYTFISYFHIIIIIIVV